uniref:Uncharacterized protein n=1 Tax=Nelumbo nucifera TaxID=4432 RepID=A0A822Y1M2_NELNU|nr:TPA_asm: hypothetical protein HUJ06_027825 [Nelumbo nucifera]
MAHEHRGRRGKARKGLMGGGIVATGEDRKSRLTLERITSSRAELSSLRQNLTFPGSATGRATPPPPFPPPPPPSNPSPTSTAAFDCSGGIELNSGESTTGPSPSLSPSLFEILEFNFDFLHLGDKRNICNGNDNNVQNRQGRCFFYHPQNSETNNFDSSRGLHQARYARSLCLRHHRHWHRIVCDLVSSRPAIRTGGQIWGMVEPSNTGRFCVFCANLF